MSKAVGNELFPSSAWRLLLPDPTPHPALESVEQVPGEARLAVAWDLRPESIDRLAESVAPGGTAYVQCRWPGVRGVTGVARNLARAGFADMRFYVLCPGRDRWRTSWWIPVGEPAIVRYLLRQRQATGRGPQAAVVALAVAVLDRLRRVIAGRPGLLFPTRPHELCAVAVRASASSPAEATPGLALACPPTGQGHGAARSMAMRVGGSSTDQPMLLLFDPGAAEPSLLIKVPDSDEERAASRREQRMLEVLAGGLHPVGSVPSPLPLRPPPGLVALAQTAVPGRAMTALITPRAFEALASAVTDWLAELALATREPAEAGSYPALIESAVGPVERSLGRRFGHVLAGFDPRMTVMGHGDLGPWNILVERNGRIGVHDWADAVRKSPPGCDLVHFLTHLGLCAADAYEPQKRRAVIGELRDPRSSIGAVVARCFDHYHERLELEPVDPEQLRVLTWTLATCRRLRSAGLDSIYAALLADELGRP